MVEFPTGNYKQAVNPLTVTHVAPCGSKPPTTIIHFADRDEIVVDQPYEQVWAELNAAL